VVGCEIGPIQDRLVEVVEQGGKVGLCEEQGDEALMSLGVSFNAEEDAESRGYEP
jgi:hypothetical protein